MDQSKSSEVKIPTRKISLELIVGLFSIVSLAAIGYLCINLGGLELWKSDNYYIYAEFDNISGLKNGASVEIAGVPIGEVMDIQLKDPAARVRFKVDKTVRLKDDDIASIRTKGIIGDRYVKISRGSSETNIPDGGDLTETESVVDIEDLIGKLLQDPTLLKAMADKLQAATNADKKDEGEKP